MYEFDADRAVEAAEPGKYLGTITDRWDIGSIPNGGYVMAVAMAALEQEASGLDPLTSTAHYLRPLGHGPVAVHVERVKQGRKYATLMARMIQAEKEHARVLATFGPLGTAGGVSHIDGHPPDVDEATAMRMSDARSSLPAIAARLDVRLAHETSGWMRGERGGPARLHARIRFADGRPPDVASLVLFADALPPPALAVVPPGWLPTLELTVHHRARPAPGWLTCAFRTRFVFGGYLEEDGEIWDEQGTLVALSRQLALVP